MLDKNKLLPKPNSKAAELISLLFNARTNAHFAHLQTSSFAQHKALDEFYNGVVELADRFAESYQGCYGIITGYNIGNLETNNAIQMLENQKSQIMTLRKSFDEPHLQQIIDDITELYSSTLYKMKFLK